MGFLGKFIKFNSGLAFSGVAYMAYIYPELRKDPSQLVHAMVRGTRCASTFGLMATDYLRAIYFSEITGETHKIASQRAFNCFRKNGGPYIKFG